MGSVIELAEKRARTLKSPAPVTESLSGADIDLGRVIGGSKTTAGRLLTSLLDEDTIFQLFNRELSAMRGTLSSMRRLSFGWLAAKPRAVEVTSSPSWQDVHCSDTARLVRRWAEPGISRRLKVAYASGSAPGADELDWARRNPALVHLLRTGQWQSVPSTPPASWVEKLASECSRIEASEARNILIAALGAVPQPTKAPLPQPLSPDEREWVDQNSTTVHQLCKGQLRGIPTSPSRAWITGLQSAIGGTRGEIAAILDIVLNAIARAPSAVVAA